MSTVRETIRQLRQERLQREREAQIDLARYQQDPVGYIRDRLGVTLWQTQLDVANALVRPPYRALVKASHSVGKTHVSACLTSWFYDCFPEDSAVITTAPTRRDVVDLLWREIRLQRGRRRLGGFTGPAAPEMASSPSHYAKGFTARKGESFQGRHPRRLLIIFDEAVGVDPVFWTTAKTMLQAGNPEHLWLCCFNPTDTASQAYQEEQATDLRGLPTWTTITMSSLDHPNLQAQLRGEPPPYPGAVTLEQFEGWVADWCDPIDPGEVKSTDLEWPPGSGRWYRPGPLMQARALGQWPSQGTYGVWSDALWAAILQPLAWSPPPDLLPEIGCDPARHGDDWTAIHLRWGPVSLHHERHNGWSLDQTAGKLKQLCQEWAEKATLAREKSAAPVRPQEIKVKVDADGLGVGVIDMAQGYSFVPVSGQGSPQCPERYPTRRSELWFQVARRARDGKLSLARLPSAMQQILRQQAMAPVWKPDAAGLACVERKEETKKRLGGASPDDMDALNLAYAETPSLAPAEIIREAPTQTLPGAFRGEARQQEEEQDGKHERPARGLFGRQRRR